jgi:hypothetical protein
MTRDADRSTIDAWTYILGLFALGNLANGLWMLADPPGWYTGLPAAVPDTGPLNEHFVRDIGGAFVMMAVGLGWAAVVPAVRLPVVALVTLFHVLHAAVHVYDTVTGRLGPEHWLIDLPVYVPAGVLLVLFARVAAAPAAR